MDEFWSEYIAAAQAGDTLSGGRLAVRSNGCHCVVLPDHAGGALGCGGEGFKVRFTSGPLAGTEVITHNLWSQGPIPAELRDQLPDNAEFGPVGAALVR